LSTAIRVLVVEDDPVLAGAHRVLVGRVAGFECIGVAHSGAEALRFLAAREVDLVLLDVRWKVCVSHAASHPQGAREPAVVDGGAR
jgi:DNA-binding NarL/FixJ family response regulator